MNKSLKIMGSYPELEPLSEPLFMYFDHGFFLFLPLVRCDLMQIRFRVDVSKDLAWTLKYGLGR
jgi:hypothetical protein